MTLFSLSLMLAATPVSHFTVAPDLTKHTLQIDLTLDGWKGDCLCLEMDGADVAVSGLAKHPDREGCFLRPAKNPIRYQVDLDALRRIQNDPDYAANLGPAWLFHDVAVFLHPDGSDTELRVRFSLPKGVTVAAPWPQGKDGTFSVSALQFDRGAYVALGALRTLDVLKLPGFSAQLTVIDETKAASDEQLREWVRRALSTLGTFYGGTPSNGTRPIHVVLAGMASDEAGVFGSVLRRGEPSVMLLYGTKATSGFESDWVALHELFHLGNPPTEGRYPWFVEGFTTYYTELLRARSGVLPEAKVWGTLASSVRAYCQPDGVGLSSRSQNLRVNHDWMRVYWSGACLALRVDVAIRQRSKGARSLDDVMRELRKGPALDEAAIVAALDRAAGSPIASSQLVEVNALPVEALLKDLGVGEMKGDLATLREDAPLSAVRRAMTAPVR